jgi:hypothetical protein
MCMDGNILPEDLYRIHLDNERALSEAFDVARQSCKNAIRTGKTRQEVVLTKNCALLLGAKLETTLLRMIYDPAGFTPDQRHRIVSAPTAADKWLRVVKEAFASRHDITIRQVPQRLPFTAQARYAEMERLVKEQFIPLIELRNSLAHGQWHRTLNSSEPGSILDEWPNWRGRVCGGWPFKITSCIMSRSCSMT